MQNLDPEGESRAAPMRNAVLCWEGQNPWKENPSLNRLVIESMLRAVQHRSCSKYREEWIVEVEDWWVQRMVSGLSRQNQEEGSEQVSGYCEEDSQAGV